MADEDERRSKRRKLAVLVVASLIEMGSIPLSITRSRAGRMANAFYQRLDWGAHLEKLDEPTFCRYYRMGKADFALLLTYLRPSLEVNEGMSRRGSPSGPVTPELQLSMTLRFLAGGSYLDIALLHGVHPSTFFSRVWRVINAIAQHPQFKLHFPIDDEDRLKVFADDFQRIRTNALWGCVGAVDGIAIEIIRPQGVDNSKSYYNRKGFFALPMQAMVDAHYRFTFASMKTTGSTHDSVGFAVSALGQRIADGDLPLPYWIAADAAYPVSESILTPWSGKNLTPDKDAFNYYLSKNRVAVEQAFGMFVLRWGILWRPLDVCVHDAPRLVMALVKLHNFCVDQRIKLAPRHFDDRRDGDRIRIIMQDTCHDADAVRRRRRDLEQSNHREYLTRALANSGQVRPHTSS